MNNPMPVHELNRGDVVLLPYYGKSRVVNAPFFDPGDRTYVKLILDTEKGMITLTCTRNMCFDHLYYVLG